MNLITADHGDIIFDGQSVGSRDLSLKEFRRQAQMVFQDSYASLNPRLTVEDSIAFSPQVHGLSKADSIARARDLLQRVGLDPKRFAERYPHELSGGQRQRVNIARALALQYISDRVMVMYLGQVVEIGECETLFNSPRHPYTRALLSSVPSMDPERRTETPPLAGDPPNPINPPSGCRFHTRCSEAQPVCSKKMPPLVSSRDGQGVACWIHVENSGHTQATLASVPTV